MTIHSTFARLARVAVVGAALAVATPMAHAAGNVQPLVDPSWIEQHLNDDGVVILDIRSEGEDGYAGGHIPGAVSAPYPGVWRTERDGVTGVLPPVEQLGSYLSGLGVGDGETVVVVPNGTDATDFGAAARVYWTLKELGHDQVAILNGGHNGWTGGNRPVETETVTLEADQFSVRQRDGLLVSTDEVAKKIGTDTVLVDARPADQFAGKAKHPAAPRFGRLPGAVNLSHDTFYDAAANRIKPVDELKKAVPAVVSQASANGKEIVSYCNTGHWAATDWFVLSELLGYDVSLYDDSMVGWTQDPEREVTSERTRLDDLKAWIMGNG